MIKTPCAKSLIPQLMLAWYALVFLALAIAPLDMRIWWGSNILPLVFVANELDSTLATLRFDAERGALSPVETRSTLPAGWTGTNYPADIHVAPSGRTVYVSNRGYNSLAVFSVAASTGALSLDQVVSTEGDWPRNFSLDPTGRWLLVANQPVTRRDARPLPYIPESAPLGEVLAAMRRARAQMAVVMDEHGGTAGYDVGVCDAWAAATGKGVKVTIAPFKDGKADESKAQTLEADRVLLAIGVKGRYDGLFDDKLGLETAKDHIKTDYKPIADSDAPVEPAHLDYKTSTPGVYAIGDVIGPPWLAHVASEEAIVCVERIAWRAKKLDHEPIPIDYTVIPGCTYCQPQIASVGFTERALKARGLKKGEDYETGQFPLTALGKAIVQGEPKRRIKNAVLS